LTCLLANCAIHPSTGSRNFWQDPIDTGGIGFEMMPNEIETWKVGDNAFAFKGTTGFMITGDMKSGDLRV
jgi:hypothetical protein